MIVSFELNNEHVFKLYFIAEIKKRTLGDILREAVAKYLENPVYNTKSFNRQFLRRIEKLTTSEEESVEVSDRILNSTIKI